MIVVFPVSHRDLRQTGELLQWIADLGPNPGHEFLIVAARTVEMEQISDLHRLAAKSFAVGRAIRLQQEDPAGWPLACNPMFRTAAEWVEKHWNGTHWIWVESDAIPMAANWLEALDREYKAAGKPFLGTIFDGPHTVKHINGVMIYPKLVRRFNPAMLMPGHLPWDCARPELTLKHAHNSRLIQRSLANPRKNEPHTFPDQAAVDRVVSKECVLFHGSKDSTLIARLRERTGLPTGVALAKAPSKPVQALKTALRKAVETVRGTASYYHSGNLGDIIYALYAIKLAGGGDLIIGPEQKHTAPCSNPVSRPQFELLLPLLRAQPYLGRVEWRPQHPNGEVTHDLNKFRNDWVNPEVRVKTGINTLCQMHCHTLGVADQFKDNEPWLCIDEAVFTDLIIVHRSPRYQAPDFPWATLVEQYRNKMLFVGLREECEQFRKDFGQRVAFYECRDFLDMARMIAGGCAFAGNQSFPCALALGLGQKVFQEVWKQSPDCVFNRAGFISQI